MIHKLVQPKFLHPNTIQDSGKRIGRLGQSEMLLDLKSNYSNKQ